MERKRVLFLGLDGAPYDLLMRWIDQGELPNLKRIVGSGAFGILESKFDETPPAWSTIYTGMNPGKHGVFDFQYPKPGTHDFTAINSTRRDGKDFWEILSGEGLRVGILNAPITYPPREINGVMVAGFLTPGEQVSYTFPQSLQSELKKAVPGFRHSSADELRLNLQKEKYVQTIYEKVENLGKAARYLIAKDKFDFFSLILSETDHVQHWFWEAMEKGAKAKYGEVILKTYRMADAVVGDLVSQFSEDDYVFVVSDHGGARLKRFFHANHFLHSIGMLRLKNRPRTNLKRWMYEMDVTQALYTALLRSNVYWLRVLLLPLTLTLNDVDWAGTRAYSFGYGQIYMNQPSEEARTAIIGSLLQLVDPETGQKPIVGAWRREEIFSGPHLAEAPHIQVSMAEGYEAFPWASIADSTFSENIDRSGTHTQRGILLLKGQGIRKGEVSRATVTDIAPTVLYLMGLSVPDEMDGKVLTQAFTDAYLVSHPVQIGQGGGRGTSGEPKKEYVLSQSEEKIIEKNLKSLGYI